jgi:hypothetical protein
MHSLGGRARPDARPTRFLAEVRAMSAPLGTKRLADILTSISASDNPLPLGSHCGPREQRRHQAEQHPRGTLCSGSILRFSTTPSQTPARRDKEPPYQNGQTTCHPRGGLRLRQDGYQVGGREAATAAVICFERLPHPIRRCLDCATPRPFSAKPRWPHGLAAYGSTVSSHVRHAGRASVQIHACRQTTA